MVDGVRGEAGGGIRSPGNSCLLGPRSYQKEGPGEQKRRLSPRVLSVPAKGRHGPLLVFRGSCFAFRWLGEGYEPVMLTLRRWRMKVQGFKAMLSHIASSRTA